MNLTAIPVLIFTAALFAFAFNISLWAGIILAFWLIASITWLLIHLKDEYRLGSWYDWPLGIPVLLIGYIWFLSDKVFSKNEKSK